MGAQAGKARSSLRLPPFVADLLREIDGLAVMVDGVSGVAGIGKDHAEPGQRHARGPPIAGGTGQPERVFEMSTAVRRPGGEAQPDSSQAFAPAVVDVTGELERLVESRGALLMPAGVVMQVPQHDESTAFPHRSPVNSYSSTERKRAFACSLTTRGVRPTTTVCWESSRIR